MICVSGVYPPCLKVPEIASDHSDEIRRQLLNATDTVISTLIVDLCSRSLPPFLKVPEIASNHCDEIRRQLLNATDTVISTLIVDLCSRSLPPCLKVPEIASDEIRRQLLNATDTVISTLIVIAPLWKSGAILDSPCRSVVPSFRGSVIP